MKKMRWKTVLVMISLVLTTGVCLCATAYRAIGCLPLHEDAALLAGRLRFINGSFERPSEPQSTTAATESPTPSRATKPLSDTPTESESAVTRTQDTVHSGEAHPVEEISVSNGNESYENITICNATDYTLDPEALLGAELPFQLDNNRSVQVLIYHTHTCESYLPEDTGEYYDDFYPRSTDGSQGVMAVGDRVVEQLRARGIGAVH